MIIIISSSSSSIIVVVAVVVVVLLVVTAVEVLRNDFRHVCAGLRLRVQLVPKPDGCDGKARSP